MSDPKPTATATASSSLPPFTLEPPEVITPVAVEAAREAVPLKPELAQQVDSQVLRFIDALASEDVHSDAFKQRLDSAFALGKEEISNASSLMQGRFMQRNFDGIEDSPAYKAIGAIREQTRLPLFYHCLDVMLADGIVTPRENGVFQYLKGKFKVEDELAWKALEVMVMKNKL